MGHFTLMGALSQKVRGTEQDEEIIYTYVLMPMGRGQGVGERMPGTFRVATWNVENLFAPGADARNDERTAYWRKIDLLARFVGGVDPDVLALQEIGSEAALTDFQQALGGTHPHRALGVPDARQIRVAFLSKWPLAEPQDIVDFPDIPSLKINRVDFDGNAVPVTRMGRGALRVRVDVEDDSVELITVHLKSKLLSYPPFPGRGSRFSPRNENERTQEAGIALMRRAAEAATVRTFVNARLEGTAQQRLIVLGDLNDEPKAQTSQILNGPEGSQIGTTASERRDRGDDTRLFNLAPLIPEARRFSRVHNQVPELLDQILVSEELLPEDAHGRRRLPDRVDTFPQFSGTPSIGDDPGERAAAEAPDHAPVMAEFTL